MGGRGGGLAGWDAAKACGAPTDGDVVGLEGVVKLSGRIVIPPIVVGKRGKWTISGAVPVGAIAIDKSIDDDAVGAGVEQALGKGFGVGKAWRDGDLGT